MGPARASERAGEAGAAGERMGYPVLDALLTIWLFILIAYFWYGGFPVYTGKGFKIPFIAGPIDTHIVK